MKMDYTDNIYSQRKKIAQAFIYILSSPITLGHDMLTPFSGHVRDTIQARRSLRCLPVFWINDTRSMLRLDRHFLSSHRLHHELERYVGKVHRQSLAKFVIFWLDTTQMVMVLTMLTTQIVVAIPASCSRPRHFFRSTARRMVW